jgi:hypothetical protein
VNSCTYKGRLLLGMRHMGYTLLLLFTAQAQPDPSASVHGIVTNAASGEGLRKAYLHLVPAGDRDKAAYAVVTNDQGAFTIENIAPGNYRLSAECTGFLDFQYGGGAWDEIKMELRLSAGDKLTGIEIKMTPQAVLSGRLLDQDGDPWPRANISVFHSVWKKGRRHIEPAESIGSPQVDDRGEFRVVGLSPGRYYVLAEPDTNWERQHHPDVNNQPAIRQQPTWYPSAPDVESSVPITLAAGQQLSGLDIRLRLGAGSNLRIRGKLTGLQDIPAPPGNSMFGQRAISASRVTAAVDVDEDRGHSGKIKADGSFEIAGVGSGAYDIWVWQGFPAKPLGRATVQVDDRDVENVSIELHPLQTLRGTVRIEGSDSAKPSQITINLEPVDFGGNPPFADPKEDGSFEFGDLGMGRYRVYLDESARKQVYLKTLRYGNAESSDGTLPLSSYGVPLELVFSTHGARLSGTITGKPATPQVILIPDTSDAARREHETRAAVFDQNGVFTLESIPPGSYRLYAFENVPEGIWLDPEFLKEVESSGVAFGAAEGDAKSIQVTLLGKTDTDRVLAKLGID